MKTRTRLISVLLLLGVIAIVAGATAFKSPDVESCNDRLARLDDATTAWATENGVSFAHRPSPANLRLKSPPVCPEGGAYTLGTSFRATTCSLHDIASIPAPKPSATEKAWRATVGRFVRVRGASSRLTCIANLRQIDGAKQQWAIEHKKNGTDTPKAEDLFGQTLYLKNAPECPHGGKYLIRTLAENPRCTVQGHSL